MSTVNVELIHERLREEIQRCGYTLTAAATAIGDPSSQNLRDVVNGRKKCPAELVSRLSVIGVDVVYVLTGQRMPRPVEGLSERESAVLDNFRSLPEEDRAAVQRLTNALAQSAVNQKQTG